MLYEINTKDRHDKIIKEMLKKGVCFSKQRGGVGF